MLTEDKGEEAKDERDVLSPPISHPAMRQRPQNPLRGGTGVLPHALNNPDLSLSSCQPILELS